MRAGLTVAHDRVQLGYKVTVFKAHSNPGGMLIAGVPEHRLPRELVRAEIDAILSMGVELKCNMRLGRDFTIADLTKRGLPPPNVNHIQLKQCKVRSPAIEAARAWSVLNYWVIRPEAASKPELRTVFSHDLE